jgi:hypothetical protein
MAGNAPSAVDRDALERAMQIAQRDPLRAEHLASKLEDEPWIEVAEFAAYCCQIESLSLKPCSCRRSTLTRTPTNRTTPRVSRTAPREGYCVKCWPLASAATTPTR